MSSRRLSLARTTCLNYGQMHEVHVEVMIRNGLQKFDIIGLPQHMIREGRDRILSALAHLGIELPSQKILVSLTPGGLPKEGTYFDLPILYAILKAIGIIPNLDDRIYLWGELSLRGEVRPVQNIVAHWLYASNDADQVVGALDPSNQEAEIKSVLPCHLKTLTRVEDLLEIQKDPKARINMSVENIDEEVSKKWLERDVPEWNRLQGTEAQFLFWALVILGRHHVLLEGGPGIGKSSWIKALAEMQMPLPRKNWAYLTCDDFSILGQRPFVAPHHSSSRASLIGGGSGVASAGALSRAHHGILFLDEFSEFSRDFVESLREPLELKQITIARTEAERTFSADTQILAAMNLCRCGRSGSRFECSCTAVQFQSYRTKVSGPIRERFDFNPVWRYSPKPIHSNFLAPAIKRRLREALPIEEVDLSKVEVPQSLTPRRQSSWRRIFCSWCRLHQRHRPNATDTQNFQVFLKKI